MATLKNKKLIVSRWALIWEKCKFSPCNKTVLCKRENAALESVIVEMGQVESACALLSVTGARGVLDLRLVMMQTIFSELIAAVLIKAESVAPPLQSVVI